MQKIKLWMEKVDGLSLRERLLIFAACVGVVFTLINLLVLQPMSATQKKLLAQVKQDHLQITATVDEISAKLQANRNDPDALAKQRLQQVQAQIEKIQLHLHDQQKALVAADKIAALLQSILPHHQSVQLRSLKTLPVVVLGHTSQPAPQASSEAGLKDENALKSRVLATPTPQPPAATLASTVTQALTPAASAPSVGITPADKIEKQSALVPQIYRHEVVLELVGNYLDLLAYVQELEKKPWQLYWGQASLTVEQHPQAVLSLHVYTLSLDQKWLDL